MYPYATEPSFNVYGQRGREYYYATPVYVGQTASVASTDAVDWRGVLAGLAIGLVVGLVFGKVV
jgi:hypothetical protein